MLIASFLRIILSFVARLPPLYFSHYVINGTVFEKKNILNIKCVLIFYISFVWNISHSEKNWARYYHNCAYVFMLSVRYSCYILMKPAFSRKIFEKSSNRKFHENPSSGSRIVSFGQADRHRDGRTDMTKLIVAFRILQTRLKNTC
jgi:hypothetical protein